MSGYAILLRLNMNLVELKSINEINHEYDTVEQYGKITICSNLLINTSHIISSKDDWHPLVIRKGKEPRVWLSVRQLTQDDSNQSDKYQYIELIVDSVHVHPRASIISNSNGFQIKIDDHVIVEAGNHFEDSIEIYKLDLRPLGLNVHGDHTLLSIGNNQMSRNTSMNTGAIFGID